MVVPYIVAVLQYRTYLIRDRTCSTSCPLRCAVAVNLCNFVSGIPIVTKCSHAVHPPYNVRSHCSICKLYRGSFTRMFFESLMLQRQISPPQGILCNSTTGSYILQKRSEAYTSPLVAQYSHWVTGTSHFPWTRFPLTYP